MGNYISCSPIISGKAAATKTTVVIPGGHVQKFQGQVKVAELMLEHSMFFVVNSRSLHVGRRFCPLSADEDLELGESYVMFPMKRVNSIATPADVAALFMVGKDESFGISYENRAMEGGHEGKYEGFESEFGLGFMVSMEMKSYCRLSSCRSRRPSLETIIEEREPEYAR